MAETYSGLYAALPPFILNQLYHHPFLAKEQSNRCSKAVQNNHTAVSRTDMMPLLTTNWGPPIFPLSLSLSSAPARWDAALQREPPAGCSGGGWLRGDHNQTSSTTTTLSSTGVKLSEVEEKVWRSRVEKGWKRETERISAFMFFFFFLFSFSLEDVVFTLANQTESGRDEAPDFTGYRVQAALPFHRLGRLGETPRRSPQPESLERGKKKWDERPLFCLSVSSRHPFALVFPLCCFSSTYNTATTAWVVAGCGEKEGDKLWCLRCW